MNYISKCSLQFFPSNKDQNILGWMEKNLSKLPWRPTLYNTTFGITAPPDWSLPFYHCVYWCQCTYLDNVYWISNHSLFPTFKPKFNFLVAKLLKIQYFACVGVLMHMHYQIMLPRAGCNYYSRTLSVIKKLQISCFFYPAW